MTGLTSATNAAALFRQLLPRLGDYRHHLVVSGGTARDLYRHTPGFTNLHLAGATTMDVDFAIADPLHRVDSISLHDVLLTAGLRLHTLDDWQDDPVLGTVPKAVACRYFPANLTSPLVTDPHVEFITPIRTTSQGNAKPQGDALIAFSLKYVDLLLDQPIAVMVPRLGSVRLPHPLAYIVQKTLIRPERQGHGKQAKDQADAFQVIVSLNKAWVSWQDRVASWMSHPTYGPWFSTACAQWRDLYAHASSPGTREVSDAYPAYEPTTVVRVLHDFIAAITPADMRAGIDKPTATSRTTVSGARSLAARGRLPKVR